MRIFAIAFSLLSVFGSRLPAQSLSDLAWLTGSRSVKESVLIEEQWMAPASNLMLGVSRTLRGDKVVEFSWFREVLDVVHAALSATTRTFGPLTGSTSAAGRQRLVDEFTAAPGGAVLVAQVRAGGVGLNIQAASVVVLCEPQVSPALEAQAIARTHRMGQVRTVRVHRLVVEDSVDQRLLETLETKRGVFDAYVRESALTEAAAAAVDVSAPHLARAVVAEEQTRLATR